MSPICFMSKSQIYFVFLLKSYIFLQKSYNLWERSYRPKSCKSGMSNDSSSVKVIYLTSHSSVSYINHESHTTLSIMKVMSFLLVSKVLYILYSQLKSYKYLTTVIQVIWKSSAICLSHASLVSFTLDIKITSL